MVRRDSCFFTNQQSKCPFLSVQRNKHRRKYGSPSTDGQILYPAPPFATPAQTKGTERTLQGKTFRPARVGEGVPGGHMDKNCISSSEAVPFEDDPCAFVLFCLFAFLMPGCLGSMMPFCKKNKTKQKESMRFLKRQPQV